MQEEGTPDCVAHTSLPISFLRDSSSMKLQCLSPVRRARISLPRGGGLPVFISCETYTTPQVGSERIMDMKWQKTTSAKVKEWSSEFSRIRTTNREEKGAR